jgi:hypothetical protein
VVLFVAFVYSPFNDLQNGSTAVAVSVQELWSGMDSAHELCSVLSQAIASTDLDADSQLCVAVFVLRGLARCLNDPSVTLAESSRPATIEVRIAGHRQ